MSKILKGQKNYKVAMSRMTRWLLCQEIGKIFYKTTASYEQLESIKEYLERSDFLKEEIFIQRLK